MTRSAIAVLISVAVVAAPVVALAQTTPQQCGDFLKLRDEAQKKALAVRTATQRKDKIDRKELCAVVERFSAAEEAVVKFLEKNKTWCGVPDKAIADAKTGHEHTLKFRKMACTEAPAAKAKEPTLSDAISQPSVDTGGNTHTGRGTLDTLSGNPLAR